VPAEHSTGGKQTLLGISKRGNRYVRQLIIHGARSCFLHLNRTNQALGGWLSALEAQTHRNKAVVAFTRYDDGADDAPAPDPSVVAQMVEALPFDHPCAVDAGVMSDGRTALARKDVDAWAGLDPLMAAAELEDKASIFFRKKEANTWGILNVREAFAKDHPALVRRVLASYEKARAWSLANPDQVKAYLVAATRLPEAVIAKQLSERTDLSHSKIGQAQIDSITEAGIALQKAGVIKPDVNVRAVVADLVDGSLLAATH
jgi:hypothetical protein